MVTELKKSEELKNLFEGSKNGGEPFVLLIGAPWCPNCKATISWLKDPNFQKDIPDVDIYIYETNQEEVQDDNSYIRKDITEITGIEVYSLPSIFYVKGSFEEIRHGGFVTMDKLKQKISALAS